MLNAKDLEQFRDLLLTLQSRLQGDVHSLSAGALGSGSESRSPTHMAELGTENFEQDFMLRMMETDQSTLKEVRDALSRLENGEYGLCEGCVESGRPPSKCWIPKMRLKHIPHARNCVNCAASLERQLSY